MKGPIKLFVFFLFTSSLVLSIAYLSLLNSKVTNKLDGALWTLPAKLYSRSLDLAEGSNINIRNLRMELDLLSYEETGEVKNPGEFKFEDRTLKIFLRGFQDQNSDIYWVTTVFLWI